MESSLRELAMYRMERTFEMLIAAEDNLKIGQYKTSLNRSYYAIFHAMSCLLYTSRFLHNYYQHRKTSV